jgi:hypothetical protein
MVRKPYAKITKKESDSESGQLIRTSCGHFSFLHRDN